MTSVLKRDFRAYFTSPIGYIYIGAYILVLNLVFYLENALSQSASVAGVFSFMLMVMMFTTPLLTMRVFSEEYKQRTDQLLLTTPVRTFDIVMGKFLSALLVFAVLLGLTLTWPLIISFLGDPNAAEIFGNYAGILCIGAAYIAMGIFISSLTENQVVAAIGSLGLFLGLYLLEIIAAYFFSSGALPLWIMSSIRFISIIGRFNTVSVGILALGDIVFFLSVCAVFLFLTARRWDRQRGFSILITAIFIAGIVLVNVLANQLTTRFYLKLDLTEQGIYTLSDETLNVLRGLDEDVTVTVLAEESVWRVDRRSQLVETLERYSAHSGGRLSVKYIDPLLNPRIGEQYPALEGLTEGDIIIESSRRYTSIAWRDLYEWAVDYNTYSTYASQLKAEQPLTSALLFALSDKTALAVFLEGHGEDSTEALQALFERANYNCQTLNLSHEELPPDTTVVVSNAPKSDFTEIELERFESYLNDGGNAIIMYSITTPDLPRLDLYLEEWGISAEPHMVMDSQYNYNALFAIAAVAGRPESLPSTQNIDIQSRYVFLSGARVITALWPTGERYQRKSVPIVASMPGTSYSKDFSDPESIETMERTSEDAIGPFILAMITTDTNTASRTPSNLVVTSASFVSDMALDPSAPFLNSQLIGAIASDFNPSGSSVIIPGKALAGTVLTILAGQARMILILLVIVMPLLIIAAGVVTWRKRRSL